VTLNLIVAVLAAVSLSSPQLDHDVPALLAAHRVPSVAIAQIVDGKVATVATYGVQNDGAPATTDTLYDIASLTKPITAQTILQLVSLGSISLDEPMYRYWTDPDIAADARTRLLTPRLALSHQTGFPNWRSQTGGKLTFKWTPGTNYGYSGEGYQYVARFAAAKMNADFGHLVQSLTFEPDGMTSTSFRQQSWYHGRLALPTQADGTVIQPHFSKTYNAADLVYSTARDYAAFMIAVMNAKGLTPEIALQQQTIQVATPNACQQGTLGCPLAVGFGLGWEVVRFSDDVILDHDGSDDGYKTYCYLSLTHRTGVVILTNGDAGMDVVVPILKLLGVSPEYLAYLGASGT
jgi:CubicO group peptidase (beta-lactamase class C family)